jgi:N,N'-diacetyllegionaminate synthase
MIKSLQGYQRRKFKDKVFIIAEAGVNHNGSVKIAKRLVDVAVRAGCDAVKFQTFKTEKLVTRTALKAKYQEENTGKKESQFIMLKRLELPWSAYKVLMNYCKRKAIFFISTPFDEESANMLHSLGMSIFKIPSGDITNKPLIQHIAAKGRDIILSTGMSYLAEVKNAVKWIEEIWKGLRKRPSLILLHCVSSYPADAKDVNLNAIKTLERVFDLPVGLSDHTLGIEVPIAAVAMGAKVIEKHFTLDRTMKGPDHKASLDPRGLKEMVNAIRNVEKALGNGIKKPADSENETRMVVRRSLVAARSIKAGEIINTNDIAIKRPGTGLAPEAMRRIVNRQALIDIEKDSMLKEVYFCPR